MSTTKTLTRLASVRVGDTVVGIGGHTIEPRRVIEVDRDSVRTAAPGDRPTLVEWRIYERQVDNGLTVQRDTDVPVRGHAALVDAGRAWGRARGIVNRGGSLYWDAPTRREANLLASSARGGLYVKNVFNSARTMFGQRIGGPRVPDAFLVDGYQRSFIGQRDHVRHYTKGWEALGEHLLRRGDLVRGGDGRIRPVE